MLTSTPISKIVKAKPIPFIISIPKKNLESPLMDISDENEDVNIGKRKRIARITSGQHTTKRLKKNNDKDEEQKDDNAKISIKRGQHFEYSSNDDYLGESSD